MYLRTTAAYPLSEGSKPGSVVVYDVRYDPMEVVNLSADDIRQRQFTARAEQDEPQARLPLKELSYNKVPAVAPLGVLDDASSDRLSLPMDVIARHVHILQSNPQFGERVAAAYAKRPAWPKAPDVDAQLYDGFFNDKDKSKMAAVRAASPEELADFHPDFSDPRLGELLLRYKGRNFPKSLIEEERAAYESYRAARLNNDLPGFSKQLQQVAARYASDADRQFLIGELQLWAEAITPLE